MYPKMIPIKFTLEPAKKTSFHTGGKIKKLLVTEHNDAQQM